MHNSTLKYCTKKSTEISGLGQIAGSHRQESMQQITLQIDIPSPSLHTGAVA